MDTIRIRGARTHNLKNIDLELPRDRLIVITGLSGSGKSLLAFDATYAEDQRRYVESLAGRATAATHGEPVGHEKPDRAPTRHSETSRRIGLPQSSSKRWVPMR